MSRRSCCSSAASSRSCATGRPDACSRRCAGARSPSASIGINAAAGAHRRVRALGGDRGPRRRTARELQHAGQLPVELRHRARPGLDRDRRVARIAVVRRRVQAAAGFIFFPLVILQQAGPWIVNTRAALVPHERVAGRVCNRSCSGSARSPTRSIPKGCSSSTPASRCVRSQARIDRFKAWRRRATQGRRGRGSGAVSLLDASEITKTFAGITALDAGEPRCRARARSSASSVRTAPGRPRSSTACSAC